MAVAVLVLASAAFAGPLGQGGDPRTRNAARIEDKSGSPTATLEKKAGRARAKSLANGLYLSGVFTYSFVNGNATATLDQIENDSALATGALQLSLWAVTERPARGQGVSGYRLAAFSDLSPLASHSGYSNIVRSDAYSRPPDGLYWIVLALSEYDPVSCPGDGYCLEDTFVSFEQVAWGSLAPSFNYSDLWWNPSESGWGVSILHHSSNMAFIAWYTYDENGRSKWYVAPSCQMNGDYCSGPLYETSGPPFGRSFDPSAVTVRAVGDIALAFTSQGSATMTYNVKGFSGTEYIVRQPF